MTADSYRLVFKVDFVTKSRRWNSVNRMRPESRMVVDRVYSVCVEVYTPANPEDRTELRSFVQTQPKK